MEMWLLYLCTYDAMKTCLWEDLWCFLHEQTESFLGYSVGTLCPVYLGSESSLEVASAEHLGDVCQ